MRSAITDSVAAQERARRGTAGEGDQEYMWQVAFADGRLDAHENHLMRRIADLLHVGFTAIMSPPRIRAREAVGGAGE